MLGLLRGAVLEEVLLGLLGQEAPPTPTVLPCLEPSQVGCCEGVSGLELVVPRCDGFLRFRDYGVQAFFLGLKCFIFC